MTPAAGPIDSILAAAVEIDGDAERREYLERACAGDTELRRRVEELIENHFRAGSFLESPADLLDGEVPSVRERPGTMIGPYKLLEQIGEGGFGVVFMAEQTRPVRRKVALKVLKPGMDTRQVVARFEAERQALALMDHPNIAHILDGGETPSGRPYFVMELVRGIPITQFCDENHLPVRERLELFVSVCQAVQHAHQKGIIHRDLKPTNVLITMHDSTPVVKVIDFGIAKATGQQLTERTLFTNFAQMVGTPMYMSPEQAQLSGLDIDTRSDVYSLGVLLYELLTGTTPFDKERLRTAAYDEIRRIIREEEPARPSTRMSTLGQAAATVSADRKSDARRLSQLFRGELDWVVMKTLEKDRNRRYETVSALAADVQRYLHDEPVQACPPTARYRFRKFARRNRRALTTAALLGVLLLPAIGVAAGSIGWAARDRSAREAVLEQEAGRALDEAEAWYRRDNLPEALAAVKRAQALLTGGAGREELRQRVRQWQADLKMVRRLEEIRLQQSEVKDDRLDHASADPAYAAAFEEYGIDPAFSDTIMAAERVRASGIRESLVAALDDWAWVKAKTDIAGRERLLAVARLADPDDWRNRLRDSGLGKNRQALEALADRPEVTAQPPTTVMLLERALLAAGADPKALAVLSAAQQRRPDDFWLNVEMGQVSLWRASPPRVQAAVGYFRAALALRPADPYALVGLGGTLSRAGDPATLEEAIAAIRKAIDLKPDYANAYNTLAWLYGMRKQDWTEAIRLYRQSLDRNPNAANVHYNLAHALHQTGQNHEAIAEYRAVIRLRPNYAIAHNLLARVLAEEEDFDEAISEFRKAVRLKSDFYEAQRDLAIALHRNGLIEDAIAEHRKAIKLRPRDAVGHNHLGVSLREKGEADESIAEFQRAVDLSPNFALAHYYLARALGDAGHRASAIDETRKAIDLYSTAIESDSQNAHQLNVLAWILVTCAEVEFRDVPRALALAKVAVESGPKEPNHWNTLGTAHYRAGHWQEAIDAVTKALELRRRPSSFDWFVLAMAHSKTGNKDRARRCYDEALRWVQVNRGDKGDLRRFQAEAADVLGIEKKSK